MNGEVSTSTTAWESNKISIKKNAYNGDSAVVFCKQFLPYTVHIDGSAFLCNP